MENINIAIVTDDRIYGKTLGMAIISVCRSLIVNVYSKAEFQSGEEEKNEGIQGEGFDLILWDGYVQRTDGSAVVCLVEKPSMACASESGRYRIYKYNSAGNIVSDIFDIYGKITGRRPAIESLKGTNLYAFCSWSGGTGCSTVAMAVCQELSRFHERKVLYLSMEELESTGCFIRDEGNYRTMGYYLYNLFKCRGGIGADKNKIEEYAGGKPAGEEYRPFMESFVMRDDFGVEAFRPTKGRNPLLDLHPEEICVFIESLINSGRYDSIVMDAGTSMSAAALTCLEMAERICLIAGTSGDIERENNYLQYLVALASEDMIRKMVKVENMSKTDSVEDYPVNHNWRGSTSMISTYITIAKDNICSQEGKVRKVLLEGDFGNKISKLTNKLLEPLE